MPRIMIVHPEGNLNNNPNLSGIVEILCAEGYEVHIYSPKLTGVEQSAPCAGSRFFFTPAQQLMQHITAVLPSDVIRSQDAIDAFIRSNIQPCDLVIGIDRGIVEAAFIAHHFGVPAGLISYELLFAEEAGKENLIADRAASRNLAFAVCQDRVRSTHLSRENGIPLDRIIDIPVAGRSARRTGRTSALHEKLGIAKNKKIALYMGAVTSKWAGIEELLAGVHLWPDDWALVLHHRYAQYDKQLEAFIASQTKKNIFLSPFAELPFSRIHELLSAADLGLSFYLPQKNDVNAGNNLKYIGMASGKTATYLQHGLPILINDDGEMGCLTRNESLGRVVGQLSDIPSVLASISRKDLAAWKNNCIGFFETTLDLDVRVEPLLTKIRACIGTPAATPVVPAMKRRTDEPFQDFLYAKKHHFEFFGNNDVELFHAKIDPDYADLKAYQDLLVFTFIKNNIPPGSRILDIGGGDSRILKHFKNSHECWNLDKLDGIGNGPLDVDHAGYRLVRDYIGNFNAELPENYFDFIFSISALEHVPNGRAKNEQLYANICLDMDRVLKPGGKSLHLFDILISEVQPCWTNELAPYMSEYFTGAHAGIPFGELVRDPSLYVISERYFNDFWKGARNVAAYELGKPSSWNVLWEKPLVPHGRDSKKQWSYYKRYETVRDQTQPRISVVTPSFNQAEYLEECIESVLGQHYPNLEFMIMDGGSTDGAADIIRRYSKFLAYWQSQPDGGQYSAINEGFKKSTGAIMTWLNSDDKFHPDSFAVAAEIFSTRSGVEWIMGRPNGFAPDGSQEWVYEYLPLWRREKYLLNEYSNPYIQQEGTFWSRTLWEKAGGFLSTEFQLAGDLELWTRFFRHAQLHTVDALTAGFRRQPKQQSSLFLERYHKEAQSVLDRERLFFEKSSDKTLLPAPPIITVHAGPRAMNSHSVPDRPVASRTAVAASTVSAIVSVYNAEKFIEGCLEDLLQQTLYAKGRLEIVIVNSGSRQNEDAIIRAYQSRYANIRYVKTEERETVYQAWNRGIKAASGTYITNANTDDRHSPDACETLADALDRRPDISIVYGDSVVTKNETDTWMNCSPKGRFAWPESNTRVLFDVCYLGPHPMWRKSLHDTYGYFDDRYRSAGDYEFWLKLAVHNEQMLHLPDVVGIYLENQASISLSDGDLNWNESERARDAHWPPAWGKRPPTAWRSFEVPCDAIPRTPESAKKILLVCDYFWPSIGGVEVYIEDLGRQLQAHGYHVDVACRALPERISLHHAGLTIHEIALRKDKTGNVETSVIDRFRTLLLNGGYSSVIALSQPDNWIGIGLTELPDHHPKIILMPSISASNMIEWGQNGLGPKVIRLLQSVDKVITVSEHGYDASFTAQAGISTTFIPHAMEQDADPADFRSEYGFSATEPLFVMVANFWPVKNHDELFSVLSTYAGTWQLAIIGSAIESEAAYYRRIETLAASDPRIRIVGGLPRSKAAAAIRDADVLLVPSKAESAGPLVVLQAMSYGTPWIATPSCNAVKDEAGGIIASVGHFPAAIDFLLSTSDKKNKIIELGKKHWERSFRWKSSLPVFVSLIEGTLQPDPLTMPEDIREESLMLQTDFVNSRTSQEEQPRLMFSIIIPTYNRSDILKKCLHALALQDFPLDACEVIVCDDGSTDDTQKIVRKMKAPFALIYLRQENKGPAAARNMGIRAASGEYLLILNDDAILEPTALRIHYDLQRNHRGEKISVLGAFRYLPQYTRSFLGHLATVKDIIFDYPNMVSGLLYDYNHFYTCNISLPKEDAEAIGGFDEHFSGPAAEDIEFGYRLEQAGYRVLFEASCIAWHDHALTVDSFCRIHQTRGFGAVTLGVRQPKAVAVDHITRPLVDQWQDEIKQSDGNIKELIGSLQKLENEKYHASAAKIGAEVFEHVKLLQRYNVQKGMLANPLLEQILITNSQPLSETAAPLISVVIPCYNYGRYLAEAVESVIGQTCQNFEIIIVNDGSTDNSAEVADALVQKYASHRIRVINQANSGQPAISRNNGLRVAKGKYFLCLDADDKLAPGMLKECLDVLTNHPSAAFAYTDRQDFDGHDELIRAGEYDFKKIRYANHVSYCALVRKEVWEIVGGYRTNVKGLEDWDFWIGAGVKGCYGVRIPKPLFLYRRHDTGLYQEALKGYKEKYAQIVLNNHEAYSENDIQDAMDILGADGHASGQPVGTGAPVVSVIVPTHNRPDMLRGAIASILAQSYTNFEIIVVNDAGKDVAYVIDEINDARIKYFRHEKNKGLAAARNTGIKNASGKYIAYLDDDDLFSPDHLETLIRHFEANTRSKIAYTDAYRAHQVLIGDTYKTVMKDVPYSFDFDYDRILYGNFIPVLCFMHEKECIDAVGNFDEALTSHEDWDLWIRMSRRYELSHIRKLTAEFTWRSDASSMTSSQLVDYLRTTEIIYAKYRSLAEHKPAVIEEQQKTLAWRRALIAEQNAKPRHEEFKKNIGSIAPVLSKSDVQAGAQTADGKARSMVSIIIPVFNKAEFTKNCIESIYRATGDTLAFEVIIIDNGSTDATARLLEGEMKRRPNLRVITNTTNTGFAGANNSGAAIAQGEYLVFLNNDTEVLAGWLQPLVQRLKNDDALGIVGAKLLYPDRTIQHCGIEFVKVPERPYPLWPEHRLRRMPENHPDANIAIRVPAVTGACLCISRKFFSSLHGFDESYGMYFEDIDLCFKARRAGKSVVYEPASTVIHFESQSTTDRSEAGAMVAASGKKFFDRWERDIMTMTETASRGTQQAVTAAAPRDVTIGIDARTFFYSDSVTRGIGQYSKYHLMELFRLRPQWRFILYGDEAVPSAALAAMMQQANVVYQKIGTRRQDAVDLMHILDPMNMTAGFDAPLRVFPHPRTSVTFFDLNPLRFYWSSFNDGYKSLFMRRLTQYMEADCRLLTISEFTKRDVTDVLKVPADRMTTILAGINTSAAPADYTVLKRFSITKPFFLHVGALDPHKNFHAVVEAFVKCHEQMPCQLVVVGQKENYLKAYAEEFEKKKIKDVFFTGFIERNELTALYAKAVSVLFLSKAEGFGFPVLEAMAQGCPVIASNTTSIPEVAGDAALLFAPDDTTAVSAAMMSLVKNPKQRDVLRAQGVEQAAKFSWTRTAELTISAWESMLGIRPPDGIVRTTADVENVAVVEYAADVADVAYVADAVDETNIAALDAARAIDVLKTHLSGLLDPGEPFYGHFGGMGDALMLLSTFYDAHPESTVVSVASNATEMAALWKAFPRLKKIISVPYPKEYRTHVLLRKAMAGLPNCRGLGTTPVKGDYFDEWQESIDITAFYGVVKQPLWAQQFRVATDHGRNVVVQPVGGISPLTRQRKLITVGELDIVVRRLNEMDITPVIIGAPGTLREYAALPGRFRISESADVTEQMRLIASGDLFIGADSWGKTLAAFLSIPSVVFQSVRGAVVQGHREVGDNIFLHPWPSIAVVNTIEECIEHVQRISSRATAPRIVWEGSQFVRHSLALINREMCRRLAADGVALSLLPFEPDRYTPKPTDPAAVLQQYVRKEIGTADVHVRHHWPPNLSAPEHGRWVVIQPWEFGALPTEWVKVFSTQVDEAWVPSTYVRDVYVASGVPKDRVVIVPNGFDPAAFNRKAKPYALKTKKKFKFLFVGGTIYRKGIDILLDAYTQTFTSKDNVCLVIKDMGGDSFYKGKNCREQIADIKKQKNAPAIEYIDAMLSEKDLGGLYRTCDVLVHPYRGEGFGLPILEAMACGTPVIIPNGGACLDYCSEANSLLVDARMLVFEEKRVDSLITPINPWLLEPSLDDLAAKMQYAVDHPKELIALGRQAHDDAHAAWTWDHAYGVMKERLKALQNRPIRRFEHSVPPEASVRPQESALSSTHDDPMLITAERLLAENKIGEAVTVLTAMVERDPENIFALNDLAAAAIMTKKYPAAAEYLSRVIALDPANESALENLNYLQRELSLM
jgi:glycosyltransferase involved in cell wall biosynthesis